MLLGDFVVVSCPHCGYLEEYLTLISGNTFNSIVWSDGKMYADMMIFLKEVVACHNCREAYWLQEAKEVGRHEPYQKDPEHPEYDKAAEVEEPDVAGYYRAIEKGMATTSEQEITLRWLAWRKLNDPARSFVDHPIAEPVVFSALDIANLERLAEILDPNDQADRVLIAEIHRELCHFDLAVRLLENYDFGDMQWMADAILPLAKAGNPDLVVIDPSQDDDK